MEQDDGHLVVDVRRLDEYESGHIPGAVCIPNESIGSERPAELPNPNQILLVYCRSGNRSKQAAEKLAALGYTEVYEFGGINDWTGPTVKGQCLTLTVKSNPTTGYLWLAEQDPELFDIREYYVAEAHEAPISGAGGWQTFILTPKLPGTAELRLTYQRAWEPREDDPQFACSFRISEDLAIEMTENGSAEAAAYGYAPVFRVY